MTISAKHAKVSNVADTGDSSLIQPSHWNAEHALTLAGPALIGRAAAGNGAAQEITLGQGLALSPAGVLSAPGSMATRAAWNTAWKLDGFWDLGLYTVTGALAITSDETGAIPGGCTQAVLRADGANIPTFDGATIPDYDNTNGALNLVQLYTAGDVKYWSCGARLGVALSVPSAPTAPVIGTAPVISAAASGGSLTFSAASGVTGSPTPTVTYDLLIGGSVVASGIASGYTLTGIAAGSQIVVRATASNSAGNATASSAAFTVTAAATAPGQVTGLTLGAATSNGQPLSWTAPSNGGAAITDYVVQYSPAGANSWATFADGTSTATSATVTGLSPSTSYDYRVAAINSVGTGTYSGTATGSTAAAATVPGAPTGLTLGAATSTTQALTWTAPASNGGAAITDYVVQYSPAGGNSWATFADGTSATASATVTGLTASTSYDYRVAAVNSAGQGAYSGTATGSTGAAAAPTNVARLLASSLVGVTESGDATNGWSYTPSVTGSAYGGTSGGVTVGKIPSGADGFFEYTVAGSTFTGGPLLALKTTQALGAYGTTVAGVYYNSSLYRRTSAGSGNQAMTTAPTPATNDKLRIGREGSNIFMDVSQNGGTSWTRMYSQSGAPTGDLYGVLLFDLARTASNLRSGGVV